LGLGLRELTKEGCTLGLPCCDSQGGPHARSPSSEQTRCRIAGPRGWGTAGTLDCASPMLGAVSYRTKEIRVEGSSGDNKERSVWLF
jgi:hypothetical protein